MSNKVFYEIPQSVYLFNKSEKPEEKVRQWTLFELLSNYGVHINNIEIERPIKVGVRTHYADIVILKDHFPYVVIECKAQETNMSEGMKQAITYANSESIKAEFAICTNGDDWIVKRKIGDNWVSVPDIPKFRKADITTKPIDLIYFLIKVEELKPLLYWLYRPVPSEYTKKYFNCLYHFFSSEKNWEWNFFEQYNSKLRQGTEILLKIIKNYNSRTISNNEIIASLQLTDNIFKSYMDDISFESENYLDIKNAPLPSVDLTMAMEADFKILIYNLQKIENNDLPLMRFILAILKYLEKSLLSEEESPVISEGINNEFQLFISKLCEDRLGVKLPDRLLDDISEIRELCENHTEFVSIEEMKEYLDGDKKI